MARKPNTLIDGSKFDPLDDWLSGSHKAKPRTGTALVADVNEYAESEKALQEEHDPEKNAQKLARAKGQVLAHAKGMARSGLTKQALCEAIALVCPKDQAGRPTTAQTVERVLRGMLSLGSLLTEDAE